MLKAYKYRLYPNQAQRAAINNHLGAARFIYNLGLETKKLAYLGAKSRISFYDLCYQLPELKQAHPWLREINAQSLQAALQNLETAYTQFFRRGGFPQFKKRMGRQSFHYPQGVKVNFEKSEIHLPKIGKVKFVCSREFGGAIKTATVSRTTTGKYYVSILVDSALPLPEKQPINPHTTIGIDMGLAKFAILSTGEEIANPRHLRNDLQRLKALQKRLSRKKKGSSNRKKAIMRVAILHERISNKREDFLHKFSRRLVSDSQASGFCFESLQIRNMVRNHNLALSISDAGWGKFGQYMAYKCEWEGKTMLYIPTFTPSTKPCNECGVQNHDLKLSDREWTCSNCGTRHNRDINAAKNIRDIGLKQYYSQYSGAACPVGPVELPALAGAVKQEYSSL